MNHPLREIRNTAYALLKPHFAYVYASRSLRLVKTPCLMVYLADRQSEQWSLSPVLIQHAVSLVVAVCVQANDDAETIAETMLGKVEEVFRQAHIQPAWQQCQLRSLNVEYDDSGEVVSVYYQQTYQVIYSDQDTEVV